MERFEPVRRTLVDGKTWWYVYDNKMNCLSTYHAKYRTKKDCKFSIDYNNKNYFDKEMKNDKD